MKRQGLVGLMLVITLSLAGCNRGEMDSEAAPTATPIPTETVEIKVRLTVDREVPSMVERFLEVQVVESVGGVMTTEAPVAAVTTKAAVDHTQGLPSEESVSIELNAEPGKEYGLRAGVFDGPERGVMLLSGDCVEADACRFYGGSNLNVHRLNLIPAVAQETFYE